MKSILGTELRRSAALGAAALIVVAGVVTLYATGQRWSAGWMALAMVQREYLVLLAPLAMAAGAWQSYREHRANVAELFASAPRPGLSRAVPILAATALAVLGAYLIIALAAAPRIVGTARYLPVTIFVVVGVGVVAMIASVWIGLAVGRLVPALATAPALAVIGFALLTFAPEALPNAGLRAAFSPGLGMSRFSDYDTVAGGVSAAQAVWMGALGVAGIVVFAVRNRRAALAALLPLALGATVAALVVPTGDAYLRGTVDPVAQQFVCTDDAPRVCVSRVHEALLPEVSSKARHALSALEKAPGVTVAEVHEDTTTFTPLIVPKPQAGIALVQITVDKRGGLAHPGRLEPSLLTAVFTGPVSCGDTRNFVVARAAAYWVLDREPAVGSGGLEFPEPEAVEMWKALRQLPAAEAGARVAAVHRAAQRCQDTTDLLGTSAR